jgi:Ca2+/Na+ antiporter
MDAIVNYISAHPSVVTLVVIFVVIMLLYFILKQFIKMLLIALFILMAVGGYYYFKDPGKTSEKVKQSVETFQAGTGEITDKLKNLYKDTIALFGQSKKVPGEIDKLLKDSNEKAGK